MQKDNISLIINCNQEDILQINMDYFQDSYQRILFNVKPNNKEYLDNIINNIETDYYSIWDYDANYKNIYNLNIYYTPQNVDISILIPVYNCENYIKECLDSCLNQDFNGKYEIIIVDDGSTDNTVKLIREYKDDKIHLYLKQHSNISDTLNYGLNKCNGTYICRMDADDIMYSYRLSYQYQYMQLHPSCDMLCCGCNVIYDDNTDDIKDTLAYNIDKVTINDFFSYHNFINHFTVCYRKSSLIIPVTQEFKLYLPEYAGSEDFELWLRLIDKYNFHISSTENIVCKYRINPNKRNTRYLNRNNLDNHILSKYINYLSNKTIGIYYIATGIYKNSFKDFLYSLKYFFPNNNRTIILISDGLNEYSSYNQNNISVEYHYINDYPWPIITLFKMKYILDYKGDYDYIFYFNANSIISHSNNYSWFSYNKLNLAYHNSWNLVDHNPTKLLFPLYDNPNSTSYIGTNNYEYVQAAFFGGPASLVYNMCETIVDMLNIDLQNNIIPKFHDETYLNKYVYQHNTYNDINIQYIFITQHNKHTDKYETQFVELNYKIGEQNNKCEKQKNVIPDNKLKSLYYEKIYDYKVKQIPTNTSKSNDSLIIILNSTINLTNYSDVNISQMDVIYTNNLKEFINNKLKYTYKYYYIINSEMDIQRLLDSTIECDYLADNIYKHNIDEFMINGFTIQYNLFAYKYLFKYHIFSDNNIRLSNNAILYIKDIMNNELICNNDLYNYYMPTLLFVTNANIKCLSEHTNISI